MEFLDHDEHHNMVSHPENSEEFAGLAVNSGVAEPPKVNPYFHPRKHRRMEQEKYWMYETIDEQLKAHFYRDPEVEALLKVKQDNVLAARQSSFVAAKDVH